MKLFKHITCLSLAISSISLADLTQIAVLPYSQIDTIGKVCEELTLQAYEDAFSEEKYTILKNISYSKTKRKRKGFKILGELDIVVLDHNKIIAIGEVKCSNRKNIGKAKKKAIQQMERFVTTCVNKNCMFWENNAKDRIFLEVPTDPEQIAIGYISWNGSNKNFMELEETYEQIEDFVKEQNLVDP